MDVHRISRFDFWRTEGTYFANLLIESLCVYTWVCVHGCVCVSGAAVWCALGAASPSFTLDHLLCKGIADPPFPHGGTHAARLDALLRPT